MPRPMRWPGPPEIPSLFGTGRMKRESLLIMTNVVAARFGKTSFARPLRRSRSAASKFDRIGRLVGGAALLVGIALPSQTQTAIANGDTRTLYLYHSHTGESITATFRVNGAYDPNVLEKLNWFLRDWRNNDTTRMDPRLFDVVWEVYRTAGVTDPIVIYSAYRSPATNAMLRRRSSGVAEYSQHMVGRAMDTTLPGMSMERIREIGMRLQRGGVGYYPGSNFVHLDVGSVRSWPRMSYDQLARLFPDGKSVHLASNGQALPRYEEARAELAARGSIAPVMAASKSTNFFAWLFGGGRDAAEDAEPVRPLPTRRGRIQTAALAKRGVVQPTSEDVGVDNGGRTPTNVRRAGGQDDAADRRNPRGGEITVASLEQDATSDISSRGTRALFTSSIPTPVARPRFEQVPEAGLEVGEKPARMEPVLAAVPLPPPRPQDQSVIARAFVDVPEPPRRPGTDARVASLSGTVLDQGMTRTTSSDVTPDRTVEPISRAATLPVVITRGPNDQERVPAGILAYAPTSRLAEARPEAEDVPVRSSPPKAVPAPQTQTVPSRLDRASLRGLSAGTATARFAPSSLLGPSVAGLRPAARIEPDILSPLPAIGYVATFGTSVSDLDCSRFTGAATKPLAAAPGLVRIMESSLQSSAGRAGE